VLLPLFGKNVLLIYAPDVTDLWPTEGISGRSLEETRREGWCSALSSGRPERNEKESAVWQSTSSPLHGFALAYWSKSKGRVSDVCGVRSYLIHSPRVLPTPRGDYFTANERVEYGGYGREGEGARERTTGTAHASLQQSMSRTERRDPNRSYRRCRLASRRETQTAAFFWPCVMCYGAMTAELTR